MRRSLFQVLHRSAAITLLVLLSAAGPALHSPAVGAQAEEFTFSDTGKTIRGKFLHYWSEHGATVQNGRAITDEMQERSEVDGKTYTLQYFERAVFELHPDNQPPYDVLLSLLGAFEYKRKYAGGTLPVEATGDTSGSYLFQETGKRLGCQFLEYWRENGGVAQFGYPISDEITETSELTGQPVRVQYFERAVFEYHMEAYLRPETPVRPYATVYLRRLGTSRYSRQYSAQLPPGVEVPEPPGDCVPTVQGPSLSDEWPDAPVRNSVGKGHVLHGVVKSSRDCSPLPGARIVLWLAGPDGEYDDAHAATVFTGQNGAYTFESNYPGFYGAGGPHIHIGIAASGHRSVETEIFLYCGQTEGTLDLVLMPDK